MRVEDLQLRGSIKSDVRSHLVATDGNLKGENYIGLLRSDLLQDTEGGKIFQHECAPCCTSGATKTFSLDEDVQYLEYWKP